MNNISFILSFFLFTATEAFLQNIYDTEIANDASDFLNENVSCTKRVSEWFINESRLYRNTPEELASKIIAFHRFPIAATNHKVLKKYREISNNSLIVLHCLGVIRYFNTHLDSYHKIAVSFEMSINEDSKVIHRCATDFGFNVEIRDSIKRLNHNLHRDENTIFEDMSRLIGRFDFDSPSNKRADDSVIVAKERDKFLLCGNKEVQALLLFNPDIKSLVPRLSR